MVLMLVTAMVMGGREQGEEGRRSGLRPEPHRGDDPPGPLSMWGGPGASGPRPPEALFLFISLSLATCRNHDTGALGVATPPASVSSLRAISSMAGTRPATMGESSTHMFLKSKGSMPMTTVSGRLPISSQ